MGNASKELGALPIEKIIEQMNEDNSAQQVSSPVVSSSSPYLSAYRSRDRHFDYLMPESLHRGEFDRWLQDNYSDLPEYYRNQIEQAWSIYEGQSFNPNLFQSFGEDSLGIFTDRQNFENSRWTTLNDSISRILDAYHKESYNSASAQLAREKAAGLNVDLSGGNPISPGEAGDIDSMENPSPALNNDTATAVAQHAIAIPQAFLSLVTTGLSIAQQFQGLQAGELSLLNQDIQTESSMTDIYSALLGRSMSSQELMDYVNADDNYVISLNPDLSKLPPRIRRRLGKSFRGIHPDNTITKGEFEKILKSYHGERYDLASILGHPFNKTDFNETVSLIGKYVNDYIIEYDKLWKDFDFDKLSFVDKETGMSLGEMEGQAAIASAKYDALRNQSDEMTENLWNNVIGALSSKNTWWSNILLFLVPFVRSMASNARLPHVGISASVRNGVHDSKDVYMH